MAALITRHRADRGHGRSDCRSGLETLRTQVIKIVDVYRGSLNSSLVRVAEVFKEAVRVNAASIIVAHNHPSGDPPSPEDIRVTEQIVAAGKLLEVEVLDHLVIGERDWVSLKAKRLGFK